MRAEHLVFQRRVAGVNAAERILADLGGDEAVMRKGISHHRDQRLSRSGQIRQPPKAMQ